MPPPGLDGREELSRMLSNIPILSIVTYIPLLGALAIVFLIPREKAGAIKAGWSTFLEELPLLTTAVLGMTGTNSSIERELIGQTASR